MGIPDPTNSLKADEVFICCHTYHPNRNNSYIFPVGSYVIVTRFPLLDPKAISKFKVQENERLKQFFATRTGVLVFCSNANVCPVDCMGGDYDGDMYFICGDIAIVSTFNTKNEDVTMLNVNGDQSSNGHSNAINEDEYECHASGADSLAEDDICAPVLQATVDTFWNDGSMENIFTCMNDLSNKFSNFNLKPSDDITLNQFQYGRTKEMIPDNIRELLSRDPSTLSHEEMNQALFWEYIVANKITAQNVGRCIVSYHIICYVMMIHLHVEYNSVPMTFLNIQICQ